MKRIEDNSSYDECNKDDDIKVNVSDIGQVEQSSVMAPYKGQLGLVFTSPKKKRYKENWLWGEIYDEACHDGEYTRINIKIRGHELELNKWAILGF